MPNNAIALRLLQTTTSNLPIQLISSPPTPPKESPAGSPPSTPPPSPAPSLSAPNSNSQLHSSLDLPAAILSSSISPLDPASALAEQSPPHPNISTQQHHTPGALLRPSHHARSCKRGALSHLEGPQSKRRRRSPSPKLEDGTWTQPVVVSSDVEDEGEAPPSASSIHLTTLAPVSGSTCASSPLAHLSHEQRAVHDLVVDKKRSVFFTGPAGSGKSVLLRAIIQSLRARCTSPGDVAVTAPTGLAAFNIGGMTIHSFAGIGRGEEDSDGLVKKVRLNPQAVNRWKQTQHLVIDEISMVHCDLFDKLAAVASAIRSRREAWGGIQLIIAGDFFQLPPVQESNANRQRKFAFQAKVWAASVQHSIHLRRVFRQSDADFIKMLNELRVGKVTSQAISVLRHLDRAPAHRDGIVPTLLFPKRHQVADSNMEELHKLAGPLVSYTACDSGELPPPARSSALGSLACVQRLHLKPEAQVMLIKNLDTQLVNGTLGKVVGFATIAQFEDTRLNASASCGGGGDGDSTVGGGPGVDEGRDDVVDAFLPTLARADDARFAAAQQRTPSELLLPIVDFVCAGGPPRRMLVGPQSWQVELPTGEVQAKRTQLPIILAWAMSVHKAQGQSLPRLRVDLTEAFEEGQAYVALSRATNMQGLQVIGFSREKVMASRIVAEFYRSVGTVWDARAKERRYEQRDIFVSLGMRL